MPRLARFHPLKRPLFLTALGAGFALLVAGCAPPERTDDGNVGQVGQALTGNPIVINEVESNGCVPGDWVELYNAGSTTVDVSGWKLLDNDNAHVPYVIPAGTSIVAGGFLVLEEAQFVFGL